MRHRAPVALCARKLAQAVHGPLIAQIQNEQIVWPMAEVFNDASAVRFIMLDIAFSVKKTRFVSAINEDVGKPYPTDETIRKRLQVVSSRQAVRAYNFGVKAR